MPRRDGLRTNKEIQVDFTQKAHDVYATAAAHQFESKVPAAFQDKPLKYILFQAVRRNRTPSAVEVEHLEVDPLPVATASSLKFNELFREVPDDALEYYEATARKIADTALTDTFRIRETIPSSGIDASYTVYLRDSNKTRHASTFKERPAKQSLIAGEFFAEEVAEYLQSDQGAASLGARLLAAIHSQNSDFPYQIRHGFYLPLVSGMPLNGHESSRYLDALATTMHADVTRRNERLERFKTLDAPEFLLDFEQEKIEQAQQTHDRAVRLLNEK